MICPKCETESGQSLFCYVCDTYLPSESVGGKASIPSRLGAFLLDVLIFLTLLLAIGAVALAVGIDVSSFYRAHGLRALLLILFSGALAYFLIFLWLLAHGQTPGKWFMDIRAVDKRDGSRPGLGRMLLRETLGKFASGFFLGLGWFWAIWDRDAQAWHDKIAGTVVLYRRSDSRKLLALGLLFGAFVLSVGLVYASFTHALNEQGQPEDVGSASAPSIAFTGNFTVPAAFGAVSGNYDPSSQSSLVPVIGRDDASNHTGKLTLLLDSPFSEGGVQKHLLVMSTAVDAEQSHADGARIDAYVFANRGRRWIAEIADKDVTRFGAFGHAFGMADNEHPNGTDGQAQLVEFGPNVYGFSLTITDGGQGIEVTSEVLIAPVEGRYQPVLSLRLAEDDAGDCGPSSVLHSPCYGFKSTVRFLNSVHGGLYDIEVDQSGTDLEISQAGQYSISQVISANHKKLYILSGDKYIE
jgi:uncharacterized RDD family membrane protein YckC